MPRSFLENRRIKEERYENIIKTALTLFLIKGVEETSIEMITEWANVSHGLFYHYFSTEQELLGELNNRCDILLTKKLEAFVIEYGATKEFLTQANRLFIETMFDSKINNMYVNYFLFNILKLLNDQKEIEFKSKKLLNNIKKILEVYRIANPSKSKKEIRDNFVDYLIYLYDLSINIMKFPNLYINRIETDTILDKFFI